MTGAKHSETCLRFEPARLCATRQENLGGTPMLFGQLTRRRGVAASPCRVFLSAIGGESLSMSLLLLKDYCVVGRTRRET